MAAATAAAIVGRTLVGWLMPAGADRRLVACASYVVEIAGALAFWLGRDQHPVAVGGVILFGAGIGNATSLPPLIAQVEFTAEDVPRRRPHRRHRGGHVRIRTRRLRAHARARISRDIAIAGAAPYVFAAAALVQVLAMGALLAGRRGDAVAAARGYDCNERAAR